MTGIAIERAVPRHPWVAALLGLVMPGLGQLYAGAPRRAAAAWVVWHVGRLAIPVLAFRLPPGLSLWVLVVGEVALWLAIAEDGARTAAHVRSAAYVPRWYNRWTVYVAAALVSLFSVDAPLAVYVQHHVYRGFRLPANSMAPTLIAGDYIYVALDRSPPTRGDVVAYRSTSTTTYVKRVVAVSGDTVAMRRDTLLIDGRVVPEPYATPAGEAHNYPGSELRWQRNAFIGTGDASAYRPTYTTWGPLLVPTGTYFVLGDNRGESSDSREHGPVSVDLIVGRPVVIYFSRDREARRNRWGRIGRVIR